MAEGGATPVVPDDTETLQREVRRLNKVVAALMNRAERDMSARTSDFALFQTTVGLEAEIRRAPRSSRPHCTRTKRSIAPLAREKEEQRELIKKLEEAYNQLLQSEARLDRPAGGGRRARDQQSHRLRQFQPGYPQRLTWGLSWTWWMASTAR